MNVPVIVISENLTTIELINRLLDKDNIHHILYQYQMETYKKNKGLKEFLGENPNSVNLLKFFGNGIIKHIQDELHLTKDEQNQLIEKIINTVLKAIDNNSTIYAQDIKRDILSHRDDYEKINIDLIRYATRGYTNRNPVIENLSPDGKIDDPFVQNQTGDCFLLSPLITASLKNRSKYALENCIKRDAETGDVTVKFKGSGKSYTISAEDIEKSLHLSSGDGDVKAIELAFDRLIRDYAYDNNSLISKDGKIVSIYDGGFPGFVYEQFFGNCSLISTGQNNVPYINFNDMNRMYSFSISNKDTESKSYTIGDQTLKDYHTYSIVRDDGFYLYILDMYRWCKSR